MEWLSESDGLVLIEVRVLPRSSRNMVEGICNGLLKIKLTAPPIDGKANRSLRQFLGNLLGCGAGRVRIVRGSTGRHKRVAVEGIGLEKVRSLLEPYLSV